MRKKKTLEDIFNDDELGILDSKAKNSNIKTEDERLIESFQEINAFFEKNNREPESTSVTEFKLKARLNSLRQDPKKIEILKGYDEYNLLNTKVEVKSVADILDDDDLGILDTDETLEIFKLKNVPSSKDRADSDFVARRKAMKEKDFGEYEHLFKEVHKDLREGKRHLKKFKNPEKNLVKGGYYVLDGVLLYLEEIDLSRTLTDEPVSDKNRKDGRTHIIFENGTESNMLYRSIGKQLLENGNIVTHNKDTDETALQNNANAVNEDDQESGWIYILKSKSSNPKIASINNLYKIGYSTAPVVERIKNASKEATYLMADVHIVASYKCYNLNTQKFENLLHRFLASAKLNVDVFTENGVRITPREWFVAPFGVIDKSIDLLISGEIVNYRYDAENFLIIEK
ncbi:GIY-YIG nuclease family protein [uncultured Lutibacter sp.]|uniref:GIY-YIG nuclease family protein n=1 Tax=uncultured Lutibacter sp. TaxID=437739 RepID=UPI002623A838|nr:GIY-YIG nuclease family protein [uncultured Lutibacter sp.]